MFKLDYVSARDANLEGKFGVQFDASQSGGQVMQWEWFQTLEDALDYIRSHFDRRNAKIN